MFGREFCALLSQVIVKKIFYRQGRGFKNMICVALLFCSKKGEVVMTCIDNRSQLIKEFADVNNEEKSHYIYY